MDTDKRVVPPISFVFYCSATHVTSQVLQPKTVNKRYRGQHTFISVHCDTVKGENSKSTHLVPKCSLFIVDVYDPADL